MKTAGISVDWIYRDMRDVPFEDTFDAAFNVFTSFGYLENDDENQKALDQVAKALKPGGKFVLDVMNRDRLVRMYKEKDWNELPVGSMVLAERQFDHVKGRTEETITYIWQSGEREEHTHSLRVYTVPELVTMLNKSGFILENAYGDFNDNPIAFDSPRYVLVAIKP